MPGYRKRPASDRKPMDPLRRAHLYQAANGLLPGGVSLMLTDDVPDGLTGPQRRRWLHKSRHLAARGTA